MTFIQTIGSRSKRISNQKTLCGWSLSKNDRQRIEILVMLLTNKIGQTERLIATGHPTGWILIIMVKSTKSMQVYMYFTRSDLFKTLCLTLICNIKRDFALRNPVIFLHFKCREGKVHVLVNTTVLSEKIYWTNITVEGKIKNKRNTWIHPYLVIFYRAWRRLGGF